MVTQTESSNTPKDWVLLSYRIPREPSTPRIAVWRKLNDLGVAKLGDGLVALPLDDRTQEHLEWVAAKVLEADGEAIVWLATPSGRRHGAALAADLRRQRSSEYDTLLSEIDAAREGAGDPVSRRTLERWRRQWRRIDRRDHFPGDRRDEARRAIAELARNHDDAAAMREDQPV